jgi:hypothetical protein
MSPPYVHPWRVSSTLPTWWWTCARFPTAYMAKVAWERVERKTRGGGELGLYRHGSRAEVGVLVTALGLNRDAVEAAAHILRDGVDEPLPRDLVESMVMRRARVVTEAAASGDSGRLTIRRPEGAGAALDEQGHMHTPRREG